MATGRRLDGACFQQAGEFSVLKKIRPGGGTMSFTFVRLVTDDVAPLAGFYREVTGVAPKFFSDAYVEFPAAGATLAISDQRTMELHGAGATATRANRSVILDFQVEDVDRERARLASMIKEFVLEPTNQPWGNRSMLFRDPDGNLINFFAPINRGQQEDRK
jgi:uncharacterized glyoxalase superfamily protein PhnB